MTPPSAAPAGERVPGWYWVRLLADSPWRPLLWHYSGWRESLFGGAYENGEPHAIGQRIPAPTESPPAPSAAPEVAALADRLEAIEAALAPGPWNETALYSAIRHVQRNTSVMEDMLGLCEPSEPQGLPDRHDGTPLAQLRNLLPTILAALRSAPDGWRSIESAPKTGVKILAAEDHTGFIGAMWWDPEFTLRFDEESCESIYEGAWTDGAIESFAYETVASYTPTHWQPLPPPPAKEPPT